MQVTVGTPRAARQQAGSRPLRQAGRAAGRGLWEFRLAEGEGADLKTGGEIKADLFKDGQIVDVTGTTKARASRA